MAQAGILPRALLYQAEQALGSQIIAATRLQGGYTPQLLHRLLLADGRTVVLKAAPPGPPGAAPDWPAVLVGEIQAYRALCSLAPWQPRRFGDFTMDGWVALLLEDLSDAQRVPPWSPTFVELAATELGRMHDVTASQPSHAGIATTPTPPEFFTRIAARGHCLGELPAYFETPAWWDWLAAACRIGDEALQAGWLAGPQVAIHGDVRSDNLFLRPGALVLIDWSEAQWVSPAREGIYWALGVEAEGGPPAPTLYTRYLAGAPPIPEAATRAYLARFTGYLIDGLQAARSPANVQIYRRTMLASTLRWFASAMRLPSPLG